MGSVYELPRAFMVCLHSCEWLLGEPTCAGLVQVLQLSQELEMQWSFP